jgi:hypothetical protein
VFDRAHRDAGRKNKPAQSVNFWLEFLLKNQLKKSQFLTKVKISQNFFMNGKIISPLFFAP